MAKKSAFVCNQCGYESSKWLGRCTNCGSWNSMTEEMVETKQSKAIEPKSSALPVKITDIKSGIREERVSCGIEELDRVLGGGLVKGSLVLVGGDPGIGKSTLLLQAAKMLCSDSVVLYVSGEESENQIKMRSGRIGADGENLYILAETDIDNIMSSLEALKPRAAVIDSIQTVYTQESSSIPGSITQIRECCHRLLRFAKESGTAVFLVGHVTKEGAIAGPRVLEHMVDCVLYFEGERHQSYRILRAVKNRFGSTNEIGVFEMGDSGLKEVPNPSMFLLSGRPEGAPGSAVVCSMEGTRPILAEIQALVSPTGFGVPRRMASGIDYNRAVMLLAVAEKRLGIQMQSRDAYINVVGGIKIVETAADLAMLLAVISAYKNIPLPSALAAVGEVGLTGEVRSVNFAEKRVSEAAKLGFKQFILPYENGKYIKKRSDIAVIGVRTLAEALKAVNAICGKGDENGA